MKYLLFLISIVYLSLSCHKETDYQQVQQNALQSHRWVLDSFYTNYNGDFKIDTVQSPNYTRIEYSSLSYSIFTSVNGVHSDTMISYQLSARDNRIYYWSLGNAKDNEVYHNIESLSDTRLTLYDQLPDGASSSTSYVYVFHAQ